MRERGNGFGFGFEAAAHLRIGRDMLGHDFDRDFAVEPQIARAIHFAHAARAERRQNFVLSEALPLGE